MQVNWKMLCYLRRKRFYQRRSASLTPSGRISRVTCRWFVFTCTRLCTRWTRIWQLPNWFLLSVCSKPVQPLGTGQKLFLPNTLKDSLAEVLSGMVSVVKAWLSGQVSLAHKPGLILAGAVSVIVDVTTSVWPNINALILLKCFATQLGTSDL